ncbi:MAG: PEP/pyruvate-binding domain-containing protein [Deltaproteobacteria bacterium]|nr:PEP/pyruvate-binding domain-containing protein [Deltaproteobacteria bacterium]
MTAEKLIFWFEEIGKEHNDLVGKKCANLGEMTRMGLAVPPGFALSLGAYRLFVKESGLASKMEQFVRKFGDLKGQGIAVFDEMSQTMRQMIEAGEIPESLKTRILGYYKELSRRLGINNPAVSVRSAGTESRPGMFETYLNVKGQEDLLEKVKKVWASAYTPRAIAFRANKGFPILGDELGVAVPKMVNARASGIAFTVNPVDGDDSKIILEANWGLGEGVVSGAESVDGFVVDKETLEIAARHMGNKSKCVVYMEDGADWADVPADMQGIPCISDEEIVEIARVARAAEKTLNGPQDMEWAVDRDLPFPGSLFWLQTRPAKVAAKKKESAASHIADLIAKKLRGF